MARHGWERIQSSRAVVNTFVCTTVICDQAQKVEIDTTDSKAGKSATCRDGGEGGIRTHGTVSRTLAFEASTFNRSVTSPRPWPSVYQRGCRRGYVAFNRNGRGTTKFPAAILPPRGKEGLEKGSGFFRRHAWRDFYLVIQFGTGQDFETGAEAAALRILVSLN